MDDRSQSSSAKCAAGGADQAALDQAMVRWTATVLDRPVESSRADLRPALLRHLTDEDFSLTDELWQTAQILSLDPSAKPISPPPAFRETLQQRLGSKLEMFSKDFFRLGPAERKARFTLLKRQFTGHSQLLFQLQSLEPGLDVEINAATGSDPLVEELAQLVGELFVASPSERACRRREFLDEISDRTKPYQAAARKLSKRHPTIASLAQEFITPLANHAKLQRAAKRTQFRRRLAEPTKNKWGLIIVCVIPGIVAGLIRGANHRNSPNTPVFTRPSTVDQRNLQSGAELMRELLERRRAQPSASPKQPPEYAPSSGGSPPRSLSAEETAEMLRARHAEAHRRRFGIEPPTLNSPPPENDDSENPFRPVPRREPNIQPPSFPRHDPENPFREIPPQFPRPSFPIPRQPS